MSSTQHQLIEQCATRLRGIIEALDNIHDTSPHRWSTDLDDVHSSAESLLALIKDQAPTLDSQGLAGTALAQPSLTLPPFAEKVLAKLRRFYDCASDFESGGVDIGRHWLDLLTQVGLLNRVQRSPALWEITQQGEDLRGTPQPSPASDLAERGTQHRFSTTQNCAHDFAGVWWNDNGVIKTGRECRHCGFFVEDVTEAPAEQAEAERPEVVAWSNWKVGTRSHVPCRTEEEAARSVNISEIAATQEGPYRVEPLMTVAQHERITGQLHDALDESDGDRWKLRSERDAANARLHEVATACATAEQERDAALAEVEADRDLVKIMQEQIDALRSSEEVALARVAELEKGTVYVEARQCDECQHGGINDSADGLAACHDCDWTGPEPDEDKCPGCHRENCMTAACPACGGRYVLVASDDVTAPVAQAQHSVPAYVSYTTRPAESLAGIALRQLKDESRWVEIRDINAHTFPDMQSHSYYPAGTVIKLPAAAPGKEVPQAWLDVQAERRRQVEVEGYHGFRDSHYISYELSKAARAYIEVSWHALSGGLPCKQPESWPWMAGFKWSDGRTMLVKACALTLAEIERLDRATASQGGPSDA
ncbi:hypothetical protein ACEP3I_32895 [Pseudomonas aeruginosa]